MNNAKLLKVLRRGDSQYDNYEVCQRKLDYLDSKDEFDIYEVAAGLGYTSSYVRKKFNFYGLKGIRKPFRGKMETTFYPKKIVKKLMSYDPDIITRVKIIRGEI